MDKAAFEKGITKIKLDTGVLTLEELKKWAEKHAKGLPTREELIEAGVHQGYCNDFWQPVINKQNDKLDLCQLGNDLKTKERYGLYSEYTLKDKPENWQNGREAHLYRPLNWMYVKRCDKKNTKFEYFYSKQREKELKNQMKGYKNHSANFAKRQAEKRKEHFDYNMVVEMTKKAFFDHNLVRIDTPYGLTWNEANLLANKYAGGLPTRQDLIDSKVNEGNGVDFWMWVQREDGKPDVVQIGNHPENSERYISHLDVFGPTHWFNDHHMDVWKASDFLYAKRCSEKNNEYIAPLTDEAKEKLAEKLDQEKYEIKKVKQLVRLRKDFSEEEYQKMLLKAEKHGIVKIPLDKAVSYDEAQALCGQNGCV